MSDFKEFEGKGLDEAIESACDYFNLKRDRLEIEILAGGSSGIFGIMGVKKAKVKARPRIQVSASDILNGDDKKQQKAKAPKPKPKAKPKAAPKPEAKPEAKPEIDQKAEEANMIEPGNAIPTEEFNDVNGNVVEPEYDPANDVNGNVIRSERKPHDTKPRKQRDRKPPRDKRRDERPRRDSKPRDRKPRRDNRDFKPRDTKPREERPRANMEDFDPAVLESAVMEVMTELLRPIVGETTIQVTIESDRVKVFIDDEENSGLIIGREGQTLSSLQYLVNRLVSRKMEASVRIQVDTGDYRERQDDKLRQIAAHLAEKAGDLGRTQSTKPLSSYHRRVVHLALQENEEVFTRSKGDGPMKRVLIVPKSRKNNNRSRY
ncbi:Jag N-terminal domain-containing protein [uncultured Pseudodesulfovibrio sp.]|uniref:Jag family protein n=1 Tax=uncultured Pseudodesulfovibrio sp. TaxID=2035858 RepID=UPI0029C86CE9|nr:Jag N-terminal domain-containing protein [uncultured Pseudodesulfovibrio sp.]